MSATMERRPAAIPPMEFDERVVYAWDDGWGEEHWWVCPVGFVEGKPVIGEDWFMRAQGAHDDAWTAHELANEIAQGSGVRGRCVILYGGDDSTIHELQVTFAQHLLHPLKGSDYWRAENGR